jgi:F0F1-type ATP synthase assembly protein I
MDLDEMKEAWTSLSNQVAQQKKLNTEMIEKMTELQYKNRINNILIPELIGALICAAAMLYILVNFQKLDTWYLLVSALITLSILIVLPILSLKSLKDLYSISPAKYRYKEMILKYNKAKQKVKFVQKLSIYLSFILMFSIIPVFLKLFSGKDLSQLNYEKLIWAVPLAIIFLVFMTGWVFKCYKNIMKSTDMLLADLEQEA